MSDFFESEKKMYNVDYCGQINLFDGAKENYAEGTEVEISYSLIATDTNYSFYVDGQEACVEWNNKRGYIIRFIMPDHDIKVYCVEKNLMRNQMAFVKEQWKWTREPKGFSISEDKIEILTSPHTDLWQRTYYHFRNDNAPVLQITTNEKFFSFVVKTEFESKVRFDQCGVVMYLDSENWLKGSIEYENEEYQHLGSVATNNGYSDWATTEIAADIKSMWYRFSRREDDYCIECSEDGIKFKQIRICHMYKATDEIQFGIYACSPEDSSFKATFSEMEITECKWLAHDGQAPDAE